MSLSVERLDRRHRALLKDFHCGEAALDSYIRRWALVHQERDYLGRTWLAIDSSTGPRLAGYFTLSAAVLQRQLVTTGSLSTLPGFPIPAVLLARLAVDQRVQGQGLGRWLLDEALRRTLRLAADGPIGFRVFITGAKNPMAVRFYESQGLTRLGSPDQWPCPMVLDLKPLITQS